MIKEQQKNSFLKVMKEFGIEITELEKSDENIESLIKIIQDNPNATTIKNLLNLQDDSISSELIKFVSNIDVVDDVSILIKENTPSTNTDNIFSDDIFTYNIVEEKDKFLDTFNIKVQSFKSDYYAKNVDEMVGFIGIVEARKEQVDAFNALPNLPINGVIPTLPPVWYDSPTLINTVNTVKTSYNELIDPLINTKLAESTIVQDNLSKFKDVLNLSSIPTLDQLTNLFDFPEGYDFNTLKSMLSLPNVEIPNIDSLKSLLNIDTAINIPSLNLELPSISNISTGLNFSRISKSFKDTAMKTFPEDTPWSQVVDVQNKANLKAIFKELENMTFYIEPGQIQVTTAGSPSTQKGVNTNRIKIKLK